MPTTITAHIPNRHDATSFYRGHGPLASLRKSSPNWLIQTCSEFSGPTAMLSDIAFFQRPSTGQELEAIRIFKRLGVPVVIDYDDLLFDVPSDNPAHRIYMNKQTQETVISCVREADVVIVSTKELKRCLQIPKAPLNTKIFVVPNALDDTHLIRGERKAPPEKRNHTVLWRGSPTHQRDLVEHGGEILSGAKQHPDTTFTFVGWNPWFLSERMAPKQSLVVEAIPIGEFMEFIYQTSPTIGMVPLHKSRFNLCKSNIAWLEMTWAGAACLVPDWEEWQVPGAVGYSNKESFEASLHLLIEMDDVKRRELNNMAWKWIQQNRMLSQVNMLREQIFLAALDRAPWPKDGGIIPEFYEQEVMELG